MALDGAYLSCLVSEISPWIGSRIHKIYQPTREEIILILRGDKGTTNLLFSIAADRARVHITQTHVENPKTPPMFCMLLRKRLGSGRLISIEQDGLERVVKFTFSCINELGDVVSLALVCEIMGRYSNLILVDDTGKIVDSIARVDATMSGKRLVLPGLFYEMPPRENRLDFRTTSDALIHEALLTHSGELSRILLQIFEGISPILAREWAFYAGNGQPLQVEEMNEDNIDRLLFTIHRTRDILAQRKMAYTIVREKDGTPKDFCFQPIHQYGTMRITEEFDNASVLLDQFYLRRDQVARLRQRADDLFRVLVTATGRVEKRIAVQATELDASQSKENLRRQADLISANLYAIKRGQSYCEVDDFYEEDCPRVRIELDARLTPAQNAQKYYTAYKKACTAQKILSEQIKKGQDELNYLDSVLDSLSRAESDADLDAIRAELITGGYLRASGKKAPSAKPLPPMEFYTRDGMRILVGRNNCQNDQLTFKIADKQDMWFHTKDIPGSHVILITHREIPREETLIEVAKIAAYYSKGRDSAQVPVDVTPVRYVKKPNRAKPGMVIFTGQRTLYVTPHPPKQNNENA